MTSSPPTYMYGLNEIGYASLVACIFFMLLSIIAVALRLLTRTTKNIGFGADDWLTIASLVVFLAFCANILVGVFTVGGGQEYSDALEAEKKLTQYLQSEYAIPPLYAVNATTVKLSILCLYRRIFSVASFRRLTSIIAAVCLLWFLAAVIADLLYCIPIRHFWEPFGEGSCFNFAAFFLAMEIVDLLLDVVIICLPIRPILGLHLSLRRRLALLAIFLLGAFVIITGAIRIYYVYRPGDALLSLPQASLWSVINLGVAILCACLPTYRPLFPKLGEWGSSVRNRYIKSSRGRPSTTQTDGDGTVGRYHQAYRKMDNSIGDTVYLTNIRASSGRSQNYVPDDGILIERDLEMV